MRGIYLLSVFFFFYSLPCFSQEQDGKAERYAFLYRDSKVIFAVSRSNKHIGNNNLIQSSDLDQENNGSKYISEYKKINPELDTLINNYIKKNNIRSFSRETLQRKIDKYALLHAQKEPHGGGTEFYELEQIPILVSSSKKQLILGLLYPSTYSQMNPNVASTRASFSWYKETLCPVDNIKPILLKNKNGFFSVFGDTRIGYHFSIKEDTEKLYLIYPSGNILFVQNFDLGLPPTMQSCGIDSEGFIWISDISGNLALFDTTKNQYLSHIVRSKESNIILIPRDNLSQSVFVFDKNKKAYVEYSVVPKNFADISSDEIKVESFVAKKDSRTLPDKTVKILYSDNDLIVSTSDNNILIQSGDVNNKEFQVNIKSNEVIEEGLFDKKSQKVFLLIRPLTNEENEVIQKRKNENLYPVVLQFRPDKTVNPFEVRELWNQHRLETISLMESAEVSQ